MADSLTPLAKLLEASLQHSQNKQAELAISQQEQNARFSISLLQITASESFPITTRLASALYFKNYIKRNWIDEDGKHKLPADEVAAIKLELIGLMVAVPANLQAQLGDAVSVIADSDFWEQWDTLVEDLVARLATDDIKVNNGVLQVAHSIFKRWRPLYRSDPLFTEINHVLNHFGQPFLSVLERTDQQIQAHASDKTALLGLIDNLNLLLKLMFDLSVQELPPIFEENLAALVRFLHKNLIYDNPVLHTSDEDTAGPLEYVKANVLSVLELWSQKYDDEFGGYVNQFIESSWTLLTSLPLTTGYDILASKALQFLTAVVGNSRHAQMFGNRDILSQIVENVLLPNLTLRDCDLELLEDEPLEYIRRDIEGLDQDTRRRASTDLLRALMLKFEEPVSAIAMALIEQYMVRSKDDWKAKDTAVYLYSAAAARGTSTTSQGVTNVYGFVNILQFFQDHLAPDLLSNTASSPVLKIDAIRYLYTFRSHINAQQWQQVLPLLVKHLQSADYIVYSYAAIAIERVLALSDTTKKPMFSKTDVAPIAGDLMQHLFNLIKKHQAPEKLQENEFLMRCIMRLLVVIREGILPHLKTVISNLAGILSLSSQNPSNPRFNYYLFEAIGACIRFGAPSSPADIDNAVYEPFITILRNDVQEFMPYIFQSFAAILEARPREPIPQNYQNILSSVLDPTPWAFKGNVPALTRLLASGLSRDSTIFTQNGRIETMLAIFQQLSSVKANEVYAFQLLECIIGNLPSAQLLPYFPTIIRLLMTRMQNAKTDAFTQRFVRLYHFISAKKESGYGADFFIRLTEEIQSGVFTPIYLNIVLPETQKFLRPLDRKIAVISLTTTLASSDAFAERYKKGWGFTCNALLKLLENPPMPNAPEDTIVEQDPDDMSFGVGYTQINTIRKGQTDDWPEIQDVRVWVGNFLRSANSHSGNRVSQFAQERLEEESKRAMSTYLQA